MVLNIYTKKIESILFIFYLNKRVFHGKAMRNYFIITIINEGIFEIR